MEHTRVMLEFTYQFGRLVNCVPQMQQLMWQKTSIHIQLVSSISFLLDVSLIALILNKIFVCYDII